MGKYRKENLRNKRRKAVAPPIVNRTLPTKWGWRINERKCGSCPLAPVNRLKNWPPLIILLYSIYILFRNAKKNINRHQQPQEGTQRNAKGSLSLPWKVGLLRLSQRHNIPHTWGWWRVLRAKISEVNSS